jgi:hypothetical protein
MQGGARKDGVLPDKTVMMEALEEYAAAGNAVFSVAHGVGERVLCKWKNGVWYPATVMSVDGWSGLCDIVWDDGDTTYRSSKKANEIAPLPSAITTAGAPSVDLEPPSNTTEATPSTAEAATEVTPSTAEAATEATPSTAEAATNTESEVALSAPEPILPSPEPAPVRCRPPTSFLHMMCRC